MKASESKYWDGQAATYGRSNPLVYVLGFFKEISFDSVLEVGCGLGGNLKKLIAKRRVGIDFSPKMIEKALDPKEDIEYYVASVTDIPFPDQSFDLVLSYGCLQHVDSKDLEKAMDEIKRVAKKHIIISEAAQSNNTCFVHNYGPYLKEWKVESSKNTIINTLLATRIL